MAKINDSSARLLNDVQARARRAGLRWAKDLVAVSGNVGIRNAIKIAELSSNPIIRDKVMQEIIIWNGEEDRKQDAIQRIADRFSMQACLKLDSEYFSAFRCKMTWSNSRSQLIDALVITEHQISEEDEPNLNPIPSRDHQDQHQRTIDVLLHRITPANAPSAQRAVRVKV